MHVYLYMLVYIHIDIYLYVYVYMYICVYVCIHIYIYTHRHVHIHTYIYICVYVCPSTKMLRSKRSAAAQVRKPRKTREDQGSCQSGAGVVARSDEPHPSIMVSRGLIGSPVGRQELRRLPMQLSSADL